MRIAFVVPGELGKPTGGYVYDRHLLKALREAHEVEVIKSPPRPSGVVALARTACRIRRGGFDAVVQDGLCTEQLTPFNRAVGGSAVVFGIVHLLAKDDPREGVVSEAVDRSYLRTVDSCVYTSLSTRRSCPSDTDSVVAYPSSRFSPDTTEEEVRRKAGRDGLRIAFVGDVSPVKRLDRLVRVVSRIHACRLTVAGRTADGGYAERVKSLCSSLGVGDRVEFVGAVDKDSVGSLLRGSDVVAVPSEYESFGTAYLEGMSFGLPAVAAGSGGAGELVEDGRNGFLVDDEADLYEAITALAEDPEALGSMGVEALRTADDWVTWEETTSKVVEHIERKVGETV
ncbi:glycosyltransferase family 4 protein [Haladaptatus sp. F3-133]|uniref:Glycosyltransferase family 4 protein n=1 Tax=Halorutilus salinus TaxID=2487751 RepID=A0A9Q4C6Z3_9EURY|nr:glycosyltransferase family 4 protein [Halorutilus salinus]MCX2819421.1 glycosyltransferase family 4 protein [Halorutilus salinus]